MPFAEKYEASRLNIELNENGNNNNNDPVLNTESKIIFKEDFDAQLINLCVEDIIKQYDHSLITDQ